MNKKGMSPGILIVILAIFLVVGGGIAWGVSSGTFVKQDVTDTESLTPTGGECDSTTTPNLTFKAYDTRNIGTALTEATNLYRKVGEKSWSTFTMGTAFAVDPMVKYEIVPGISTSDQTDNAYGEKFEYTVPCTENPTFEVEMANDEIETSLSATFYNADADAGAETFSAGQTQDVSIKLQAGVDEFFGNPFLEGNINVICLDLNSTEWDKPEKVSVKGGSELRSVSTPQRHSAVAGMVAYCYEMPVIGDDVVEIVLKLNADDTTAPVTDNTAYMYAGGYYVNAETGEIEVGVEDEDGTAVGTDASDSVTMDFTA